MNKNGEKLISLTPELVRLIAKVIKFSKGGFNAEERKELASDLLDLVDVVMDGVY